MEKSNWKHLAQSILVGAVIAFLSTLFEGLATLIKSHSTEIISGSAAAFYHVSRKINV